VTGSTGLSGAPNGVVGDILPHGRIGASDAGRRGDLPRDAVYAVCVRADDVRRVLSEPSLQHRVNILVAVTPEAAYQCVRDGHPYVVLEEFFDEAVFRRLIEPVLALQMSWLDSVDALLAESVPVFGEAGFKPARMHGFFLKILSDEMLMCAYALAHFFVGAQPREVVYIEDVSTDRFGPELFFDHRSVHAAILPACAGAYGIPLTRLPAEPAQRGSASGTGLRQRGVRMLSSRQKAGLRIVRSLGPAGLLRRLTRAKTASLLVFKQGFDVSLVARFALRQGWQCREFAEVVSAQRADEPAPPELSASLSGCWERVASEPAIRRPFQWVGVDLWPVAEPRLRHWCQHVIPIGWNAFTGAHAGLRTRRPVALLVASPYSPMDHGVLHAGRVLGVPIVTYQHGGFEGSCAFALHEMTDLRASDHRFVYGPGVEAYYQHPGFRYPGARAQVRSVGSARLDRLRVGPSAPRVAALRRRLGVAAGQPAVVYVPTMYMRYRRYLGCGDNGNVPYFQLQARMVELMREFPEVRFIYKAFPMLEPDPIIRLIADRCPNCTVVTRVPLPELLWASDLHVIDMPSTGLLEALLTPKPIVILADRRHNGLLPEARELLRKRADVTEDPDAFCARVRARLQSKEFAEIATPNQEFLLAYGLCRDDGASAARALAALEQLGRAARSRVEGGGP